MSGDPGFNDDRQFMTKRRAVPRIACWTRDNKLRKGDAGNRPPSPRRTPQRQALKHTLGCRVAPAAAERFPASNTIGSGWPIARLAQVHEQPPPHVLSPAVQVPFVKPFTQPTTGSSGAAMHALPPQPAHELRRPGKRDDSTS